jgi:hypothetical protein
MEKGTLPFAVLNMTDEGHSHKIILQKFTDTNSSGKFCTFSDYSRERQASEQPSLSILQGLTLIGSEAKVTKATLVSHCFGIKPEANPATFTSA